HLAFLAHAGPAAHRDPHEADGDAQDHDLSRASREDLAELPVEDRRHERAEGGAEPERDRVAEGDAQVAHGEAEREPAHAPEDAEEEGPEERLRVGGLQDGDRAGQDREREGPRRDDPGEDAPYHPEDLPGPAPDA